MHKPVESTLSPFGTCRAHSLARSFFAQKAFYWYIFRYCVLRLSAMMCSGGFAVPGLADRHWCVFVCVRSGSRLCGCSLVTLSRRPSPSFTRSDFIICLDGAINQRKHIGHGLRKGVSDIGGEEWGPRSTSFTLVIPGLLLLVNSTRRKSIH